MIGTMRKHSSTLWWGIIVVVVFAFVIWGTNTGRQGPGRAAIYGRINGKPVTEEDYVRARREVELQYFLRTGKTPGLEAERMGFDVQRETFQLLLLIQILNERGIYAGPEAKAAVTASLLRNVDQTGVNTLADFNDKMLKKEGFNLADLDRFMEHQIGIQQLVALEGLSGALITPQQVEALWRRENQKINAEAVFFSASNYLQSVEVTPEALGTFFTNQIARYRIPERVQVSYAAWSISNYLDKADEKLAAITNLNEIIDALYAQRGTNAYPDLTPEQAREEIRNSERLRMAFLAARQEAAAFADELWKQDSVKPSDLQTLGAQKGIEVKVTPPFDRTGTPEGLDVDSKFAQAAFRLRDDEPVAGPIEGEHHVYVITLYQRLPSANAQLDTVKDKVAADYRLQQAILQARERGRAFAEQLTNSLAAGKTFDEACAADQIQPLKLPPFSLSAETLPDVTQHTSLDLFKQAAFTTPVGRASAFNFTSDGGYVVYVDSKVPVDVAAMNTALPEFAQYVRRALRTEAFNLWFNDEAQEGLRETPINRPPPSEVSAPVN